MIADTNRRALRAALPWLFVGFLLLTFSIALWLVDQAPAEHWLAALPIGRANVVCGFLGSAAFLVGMVQLARALIRSRPSLALLAAVLLWAIEFALRIHSAVTTSVDAAGAPVDAPEPSGELGARLVLAAGAMIALCSGMIWIWGSGSPRAPRAIWRSARRLFIAQLCAYSSLYVAASVHARGFYEVFEDVRSRVPLGLGWPLVWLVFALPFAALFLALKQTVAHAARRQSVAEILTS
jgi:hypothetical protein